MAVLSCCHVQCDICREFMYWPAGDEGSDGQDTRFFDNITEAEDAALADGWERLNAFSDRVIDGLRCRACINRSRAMHAWIKQNRMYDDDQSD